MPRNVAKPLSEFDAARQNRMMGILRRVNDSDMTVTLSYTKRNGQESKSTGEVAFFGGKPGYDTGSVTILDPVKGMRTINLHRIIEVTPR